MPAAPTRKEDTRNQVFHINRRAHRRYVLVRRVGLLHRAGESELCLIRNISAGGLMARMYRKVPLGVEVEVELLPKQRIRGTVLWAEDWSIGVRFAEPVNVEAVVAGRWVSELGKKARMPRIAVSCPARLRVRNRLLTARALDISEGGIKVQTQRPLEVEAPVTITLPDLPPMKGHVRWTRSDTAGIAFIEPLPFEALAAWLQEREPKGSQAIIAPSRTRIGSSHLLPPDGLPGDAS